MFKISTWNVNSLNVRLSHVKQFLQNNQIDILCLQELKIIDSKFPLVELQEIGYEAIFMGQPTYNGVAIIYKKCLQPHNIQYNLPNFNDEQKRLIKADFTLNNTTYHVICAYFPNGQSIGSDKFIYKLLWIENLFKYITASQSNINLDNLLLLGDYNITLDDMDIYDPIAWQGSVLCSKQERAFFTKLSSINMYDAYRYINIDSVKQYTWWDYRQNSFKRNMGLRIDHIWVGKNLLEKINSCLIIKRTRSLERPSDHAPVTLDIKI